MYYYGNKEVRVFVGDQSNGVPLSKMTEGISKKYVAYCNSRPCSIKAAKRKVVKDVPRTSTLCPDCKRVLLWKIETIYGD